VPDPAFPEVVMSSAPMPLRDLFDAALALAPGERAAFLDRHCPDPVARTRLQRLLAAAQEGDGDERDGDALPGQSADRLAAAIGDIEVGHDWTPGRTIGPYLLLEVLGEGGSATVFRAERDLDGVRQAVALKLLHRGLYSPQAQRLFRRERQALASLSHPNIAHLIDGGVTDSGHPYLVMEYIDGAPITQYAAQQQLDVHARLRLLAVVCRAVAAAHRALIVHRDLKPSNILVDDEGRVKLLDFGIAKLLGDELDEAGTTLTGYAPLTPAYAAPEQFSGGAISTATDVFALGVVLHELLLGERPTRHPAQRPSARVAELVTDLWALPAPRPALRAALRGDLDTIVLKALAEEPERRYASAADLADDVERHLDSKPVRAHPPSTWYRTRKFVQRHRGGVLATAALSLGLIASLAVALWQAGVAREQARIARTQTSQAEAVRDFLVGIFDAQIPARPGEETPGTAELLRRGAERAMTELAAEPALQSTLLVALARVYDHLDYGDQALPLLEQAIAAARQAQPADPRLLAAALSERGALDLARDRYPAAIGWLDQAIALQTEHAPDSLDLAVSLDRRALVRSQLGDDDAAIADYTAAMTLRERRLPADHPERIHDLHSLGSTHERAGRHEAAAPLLERAAALAQARFGDNHVKSAHYLKSHATNLAYRGQMAAAVPLLERAVAAERRLYPPGHTARGQGLNNLGVHYLRLGRLRDALTVLDEVDALNTGAGQGESMGQTFVLGNLARCHETLGDGPRALAQLRQAERIAIALVGAGHARTLALSVQRARLEAVLDASASAQLHAVAGSLLAQPDRLGQFAARSLTEAQYASGLALTGLDRGAEAAAGWAAALADATAHDDPFVLAMAADLAQYQRGLGDSAAASALLDTWIPRAAAALPPGHYALGQLHLVQAELAAEARDPAAAGHARAAATGLAELPATHPWRQRLAALAGAPPSQR
jgi:serine/threonine-protein kinase